MISLTMKTTDNGTDRNITLNSGWNLIGYDSDVNLSLSAAKFYNATNSYTFAQAVQNWPAPPKLYQLK